MKKSSKLSLKELVKLEDSIKPVYGTTYTIPDSVLKKEIEMRGGDIDAGKIPTNADGTIAEIPCAFMSVDTDVLYLNHFRKVNDTTIEVVCGQTGYLANKAKNTNQLIPQRDVPAYVVERKDKKLQCTMLKTVKDSEFQEEFSDSLSDEVMATILPLTEKYGVLPTKSDLPI